MNKQELNNGFESFNPTEEQKQRMFANIMEQKSAIAKKAPMQMRKKIYIPACGVAAAVLMFALLYGNPATKNLVNDTYLVQNSEVDIAVVSEYAEKTSEELYTDEKEPIQKAIVSQNEKVQKKNKSDTKHIENNDKKFSAEKDSVVAEPEIIPGEVTAFAMNINTASVPLRARSVDAVMVSEADVTDDMVAYDEQIAAFVGGAGGASDEAGTETTVTYGEFCANVGFDAKNKLILPDDMKDITDSERILSAGDRADEWNLVYQGEEDRILTVNISRDMGQNEQYFETDNFIKTDFNGTAGVVIYDGVCYTAYMNNDNIAYVVNTNMTENELADLLLGMTLE